MFITAVRLFGPTYFTVVAAVFTLTECVEARPELFLAQKRTQLVGYPRDSMIVVTNEGTTAVPRLRMRRPGMIPVDQGGHFKWFSDERWRHERITPLDQFNLTDEMFGAPVQGPLKFQDCVPLNGIPFERPSGQVAWLASCEQKVLDRLPAKSPQVAVDLKSGVLASQSYEYKYKAKNHMLFDSIRLKSNGGSFEPFTHDADLLIRADIRNFFTLQFDSDDIGSRMRDTRVEDFGALATMQFYLKILFFKITLDLDTDIAFFNTAAHMPMVLTVPPRAEKKLNPKSGILYSFVLDQGVVPEPSPQMPRLDPAADQINGGPPGYCTNDVCKYAIRFLRTLNSSNSEFSIELAIPKNLVDRGMYPRFVDHAVEQGKDMGWIFSKQQQESRRHGIYFEVSNLPAGEHPWDLWLGLKP